MTVTEIQDAYPQLAAENIRAVLSYAAETVPQEVVYYCSA